VDYAHFSEWLFDERRMGEAPGRPADLPPGKIVGFIGLLSEWVDQALLVRLAREVPETQVVLIGRADVAIDRLRVEPNIHVLGPRPFGELPAYVAHFAAGIIPFVVDELTRAVNPIKLREMMAAGCPVVCTDLPEVAGYARAEGGGVAMAADGEEFVRWVREAIARPPDMATRRKISEGVRAETWAAKTKEIVDIIAG
jgi:glycosyltransferase involved in cell wall biosynthesis